MTYSPERSVMLRVGAPAALVAAGALAFYGANEAANRSEERKTKITNQKTMQDMGGLALDDCTRFTYNGCDIIPQADPLPPRMTPAPEVTKPKPHKEKQIIAQAPEPSAVSTAERNRDQDRASRSRNRTANVDTSTTLYQKFEALAECESSGNWSINTGNGFYGGIQFMEKTWDNIGGERYADRPDQASKDQQIEMGIKLYKAYGDEQWPVCGDKAGL